MVKWYGEKACLLGVLPPLECSYGCLKCHLFPSQKKPEKPQGGGCQDLKDPLCPLFLEYSEHD